MSIKILRLTLQNMHQVRILGQNRNQAFADAGFEMHIFTPTPTRGVTKEMREVYKRNKREEELYGGALKVHRFNLYSEGKNPLLRALRYFLLCCILFWKGTTNKHVRKADVIFVGCTPPILGACTALVKKFIKVPFFYNLQDIFPDSLAGAGLAKKGGIVWKIGRVIENFTYKHTDKIIVISEDFKRKIMAKGVPEEKIEVV